MKLFVLGIDGCSPHLINNWIDKLPTFSKLIKEGHFSIMKSTIPPVTCPAWPCMFTGKNPAELGMYGFAHPLKGTLATLDNYNDYAVWTQLGSKGFKTGLFNVPITYPPIVMNGFNIPGLGTPTSSEIARKYTYPIELGNEVLDVCKDFVVEPPSVLWKKGKEDVYLDLFIRHLCTQMEVLDYLIKKEWDLFIFVPILLDRIQHYYWEYMEKGGKHSTVILNCYKVIDTIIEDLLEVLPKDTNLLIVSDHGFQGAKKVFRINNWLEEKGYLKFSNQRKNLTREGLRYLVRVLPNNLIQKLSRVLPPGITNKIVKEVGVSSLIEEVAGAIDWSETKAVGFGGDLSGAMIYITDKAIKEPLLWDLKEIKEVQAVCREDVYYGDFIEDAPDIILLENECLVSSRKGKEIWAQPEGPTGIHSIDGIFIGYGPDIKRPISSIHEVAPLILEMFGTNKEVTSE